MTNGQNGDDRLLDYLYGEMSPEERQAFEAELANDPALRQTYDRYRDVTTAYEQLEPVEPPRSSYYDILREARRAVSPIESSEPSMMQRILSLFRSPGVAVALTLTIVVGTSVIFMKRSTIETEGERQDRRYVREREEGVKEKPRTPYTKGSDDGPRARVPYTKSGTDGV
ncbi:MAG: hypothetical protein KC609_26875, partial [Myxococcales bacterium]|nr:hypothetical protein [Myxococcales bacterium]